MEKGPTAQKDSVRRSETQRAVQEGPEPSRSKSEVLKPPKGLMRESDAAFFEAPKDERV